MSPEGDTAPVAGDLLDAVLDASASLIVVIDVAGNVVRLNRACERLLGYGAHELEGETPLILLMPEHERPTAARVLERLQAGESPVVAELHLRTRAGEEHLIRWSSTAVTTPDGAVTHIVSSGTDLTEERRAAAERAAAEEQLALAFDNAPIGMSLSSMDGRFLRANAALCAMLGYSEEELLGKSLFDLTPADDVATAEKMVAAAAGPGPVPVVTKRSLRKDGSEIWIEMHVSVVRDARGNALHVLSQILDVTARRQLEQRLRHLADHDSLTGLFNRRRFEDELERHVAHGRRYGMEGALLVLDLDGFKDVNDRYGHRAGDRVLAAVAGVLRHMLRESDIVARIGGDEFAALLPHAGERDAEQVAATVREAIAEGVSIPGGKLSASVGWALFEDGVLSPDDVLSAADAAMYAKKGRGQGGGGRDVRPAD
jgi:diguanylate cyclase (GGDEF)-like protein/PAS domain S-box-containing protein